MLEWTDGASGQNHTASVGAADCGNNCPKWYLGRTADSCKGYIHIKPTQRAGEENTKKGVFLRRPTIY